MLVDTFTQFYLLNSRDLADTKRYELHIRPVCMIFDIFINLIQGGYVIVSNLITDKPYVFKHLLKDIVHLLHSIKVEDYQSYIVKTVVVYDVIKLLFCDFITHIELDDKCYFDTAMGLVEEGIDSLHAKCVMKSHNIVRLT
jgi:hypothetical protein